MKNLLSKIFIYTRIIVIVISVVLLFITFYIFYNNIYKYNYVIFNDVGQGDSTLIKLENGENILYDTGKETFGISNIENNLNGDEIDYLILSHSDADHAGKADYFIQKYNVKNIFVNLIETFNIENDKIISLARGDYLSLSDKIKLAIINPDKNKRYNNENESSLGLVLSYNNFRFIMMADIGKEEERNIVANGDLEELDNKIVILKVGHHGSNTSSSEIFLKKIHPDYCVISVGQNNSYGHPSSEVLTLLKKYCNNILRTDELGNIIFKLRNNDLEINYYK